MTTVLATTETDRFAKLLRLALGCDETGKRVSVRCVCGAVHVVGIALESGACRSCGGCRPLTPQQRQELRAEQIRAAADRVVRP
jgi:hypothetical protein